MSKVLVDRELLELLQERLDPHRDAAAWGALCDALRRAQPAEAEEVSNARLMNTLAELARRAPLRTLHTICETQHQVSTVKLERYLEPVGDTLAGYAFTLRIDFDKLSAALSAVTAERDALKHALDVKEEFYQDALHSHIVLAQQRDQLRAEVEAMRKDAERYRWASSGVHEAETLVSIVNCHGGYAEKVAERVDVYREAAMAAKEA
jgi:hypothetical protein